MQLAIPIAILEDCNFLQFNCPKPDHTNACSYQVRGPEVDNIVEPAAYIAKSDDIRSSVQTPRIFMLSDDKPTHPKAVHLDHHQHTFICFKKNDDDVRTGGCTHTTWLYTVY